MRFVVIFRDEVDPSHLDPALNAAHFAFLEASKDFIVLAGGLRQDLDRPFCGALWIVEAADRVEVLALVGADPYAMAGLWLNFDVLAWGRAPFYGPVTL